MGAYAVAQLVEALVAGSISDGVFEIFRPQSDHVLDSASNRNKNQGFPLGVKAAGRYDWKPCHIHVPTVWKFSKPLTPGALGSHLDL
jgi:hypothetical protein